MATGYIIWDRKNRVVVSPSPDGVYTVQADADAALNRMKRKDGADGFRFHNLERTTVNYD